MRHMRLFAPLAMSNIDADFIVFYCILVELCLLSKHVTMRLQKREIAISMQDLLILTSKCSS